MEQRLAHLESWNRILFALVIVALIAVAACSWQVIAFKPPTQTITAQSFQVVDAQGSIRGVLGTVGNDLFLTFSDVNGTPRYIVSLVKDRVVQRFVDENKKTRSLTAVDSNGVNIDVNDVKGQSRLVLYARGDGDAGMLVFDGNGRSQRPIGQTY